jgi:transketolase
VSLALEAKGILADRGSGARVVSMPSLGLFLEQPAPYRDAVLPPECEKITVIEAGSSLCWGGLVGRSGLVIGMDHYGASAPGKVLAEKFGFTAEQVAGRIAAWL